MLLNIITFTINEILSSSVEAFMIIAILSAIGLEKKYEFKYSTLLIILEYTVCIYLVNSLDASKSIYQLLLSSALTLLIIEIHYKGSFHKKVIPYGLFMLILMIGEVITLMSLVTFTDYNLSFFYSKKEYYSLAVIISKLIELFILKYTLSNILKEEIIIKEKYIKQTVLLIISTFVVLFVIVEMLLNQAINENYIISSKVITLSLITLSVSSFLAYIIFRIINETRREVEHKQFIEQYELEVKYSSEINNVLSNLRKVKHQLNNHISCMWGLLETNSIKELKQYLDYLTEQIKEDNLIYIVNESEIASLLNYKFTLARDRKILIDYNIDLNEDILLDRIDICQVLSNAFDYCIQYSMKIDNVKRKIYFNLTSKDNHIFINISVNKDKSKEKSIKKEEKINKSVNKQILNNANSIIEKHNGKVEIQTYYGTLNINIILPNVEKVVSEKHVCNCTVEYYDAKRKKKLNAAK